MGDGGEVNVKVHPESATVELSVRAPLGAISSVVTMDAYSFIQLFGGATGQLGTALVNLNAKALRAAIRTA